MVRNITGRAIVNSSTFYRHYLDKYDLLEQYLHEMYALFADRESTILKKLDIKPALNSYYALLVECKEAGVHHMQKKLTIHDIAKIAGVSAATVSRVLNQKTTVDPGIREHVMKIVNEHGFVPSIAASALRGGRTQLIGVLSPPLTFPFVPEIMLGVSEVADRTEYEVVLYMMSPVRDHKDVLDRILMMKLSAGLIAIVPGGLGPHLDYLSRQGISIVTIEDQVTPINTPWIGIDNVKGGYEATHYLLSLGHRRIAHISGPAGYLCTNERYEGYCQALHEAGLDVDPGLRWQGDFSVPGGRACAQQMFSRPHEEWPDAIFTANDQTAFGVMDVAEEYGLRIPDDFSLIGFDDMPIAPFTKPGLTTIRQPHREMGVLACELLLSSIDSHNHPFMPFHAGEEDSELAIYQDGRWKTAREGETFSRPVAEENKNVRVLLPTRLIERESCRSRFCQK
jgi:LacI family transcriptional regulator